jgi:hypothetical protein
MGISSGADSTRGENATDRLSYFVVQDCAGRAKTTGRPRINDISNPPEDLLYSSTAETPEAGLKESQERK